MITNRQEFHESMKHTITLLFKKLAIKKKEKEKIAWNQTNLYLPSQFFYKEARTHQLISHQKTQTNLTAKIARNIFN